MGLPEDYEAEKYFCEQCKPENHKKLVAAIAKGEKPWEEAIKQREQALAEKAKKKGGRKGRKSAGAKTEDVIASASQEPQDPELKPTPAITPAPTPAATSGQKRKLEESPSVPEIKVCCASRLSIKPSSNPHLEQESSCHLISRDKRIETRTFTRWQAHPTRTTFKTS